MLGMLKTIASLRADRRDADGNVQVVGKRRDLGCRAIGVEAVDDPQRVAAFRVFRLRVRILDRAREPQPAGGIEIEVHRLVNVRLGGDELNLKAGRQMKRLQLLLRRAGWVFDDVRIIGDGCGIASDGK